MGLPQSTIELLRDEAYVHVCRHALQERVESIERETAELVNGRPPFGVLAFKRTRDAFEHSLQVATDSNTALRERLVRFARIDTWLRACLREDLAKYLDEVSPDYQRLTRVHRLLGEWEYGVGQLPDLLVGFARDLRGVRLAAEAAVPAQPACAHELAVLREMAVRLEAEQAHVERAAAEIAKHGLEMAAREVRVPSLPPFRRTIWVDWLCVIPIDQALAEVTRVEHEVRTFLNSGLPPLRAKLQVARSWCLLTQENLVNQYWEQLREHARAHYVGDCDADDVLNTLTERYDSEIVRRQRGLAVDPFLSER